MITQMSMIKIQNQFWMAFFKKKTVNIAKKAYLRKFWKFMKNNVFIEKKQIMMKFNAHIVVIIQSEPLLMTTLLSV